MSFYGLYVINCIWVMFDLMIWFIDVRVGLLDTIMRAQVLHWWHSEVIFFYTQVRIVGSNRSIENGFSLLGFRYVTQVTWSKI